MKTIKLDYEEYEAELSRAEYKGSLKVLHNIANALKKGEKWDRYLCGLIGAEDINSYWYIELQGFFEKRGSNG